MYIKSHVSAVKLQSEVEIRRLIKWCLNHRAPTSSHEKTSFLRYFYNSTLLVAYLVINTNFMVRLFFKCVLHLWASFTKHKQAVNSHRVKSWSSCINNVNGKLVPANTKRVVWRPEMKDVTENHQLRANHSKMMKNVLNISTIQICQVSKLEMCSYWTYKGIYVTRKFSGRSRKKAPAPIWP